jgi:KDO2-lipid IV(A) lauroyltransferase
MSEPAPRPPLAPGQWPVWIALAFGWTLARWPWRLQLRAGPWLGALMRLLMRQRGHIIAGNLALAFPELDERARRELLRANFAATGIGVFEFLRAWFGRADARTVRARIDGLEQVRAIQAQGRGVLLAAPHFLTLEIGVRLLARELAVTGVYRPHDEPAMEWAVRRARARYTRAMFPRDAMRPIVRHLKQGGVLWFAPDQRSRRGESVAVPFFGQDAHSLTSVHQLARLSGAAVLPLFQQRLADGSYRIEIGAALADFPSADPQADTARIMAIFEAMIRRIPEQYLWMHRRFALRRYQQLQAAPD